MTLTSTLPDRVHQLLHERFGYQDFRPGQAAIIDALLQGQHVLTVMPTGSGKSLCYQLPALLNEGCTLVISPLIALMKDQVDSLQAHGIAATFVNSSLSPQEQQDRLYACRAGHYKLLYIAPERFRSQRFLDTIAQTRVSLFAVDEAHCISQWGHDFRPDYLRLRQAIEYLQQPQVLALTATASDPSAADTAAGFTFAWSVTRTHGGITTVVETGNGPAFTFTNTVIDSTYDNLNVAVAPEPATLALFASGLIGSVVARRRSRRRERSATVS